MRSGCTISIERSGPSARLIGNSFGSGAKSCRRRARASAWRNPRLLEPAAEVVELAAQLGEVGFEFTDAIQGRGAFDRRLRDFDVARHQVRPAGLLRAGL